ncbi:oxidation resistance protein 1 [Tulasnella sp. 403]|nr:oxidation resistance protein 1 [Tulasnella sp. 403]
MADPPRFSFEPLIPLPKSEDSSSQATRPSTSPFSSLFDVPTSEPSASSRPLFPDSDATRGKRTSRVLPVSIASPPQTAPGDSPPTPASAFGEFVSFDPLQEAENVTRFSPMSSPEQSRPRSEAPTTGTDPPNSSAGAWKRWSISRAFEGNSFVQEATARTQERVSKVMGELVGRDEDDPLGWLNGGWATEETQVKPFDSWDGFDDDVQEEIVKKLKSEELQAEIRDHSRLPKTPRASPSSTPQPALYASHSHQSDGPYDSDDDVIDLKTGRRGRLPSQHPPTTRVEPIPISSSAAGPSTQSQESSLQSYASAASSYLTFTIPRKWFSSPAGPSPPLISSRSSGSLPRAGITRQSSVGEFTHLPHPDLTPYGTISEVPSPRTPLATIFDSQHPPATPFAKPFKPDENWNPSGFEYDPQSKRDTLGSERLDLSGRSDATVPVLSQEVADMLRPYLPPLPRLSKTWTLLYSTDQHGMSIGTLYKNVEKYYGASGGCILAVREATDDSEFDENPNASGQPCFGVWVGSGIRCNEGAYFGSGESFLWKTTSGDGRDKRKGRVEGVKVFKWTGRNDYVALCEADQLSFGGGDGKVGLFVDSSFVDGTSERTFVEELPSDASDPSNVDDPRNFIVDPPDHDYAGPFDGPPGFHTGDPIVHIMDMLMGGMLPMPPPRRQGTTIRFNMNDGRGRVVFTSGGSPGPSFLPEGQGGSPRGAGSPRLDGPPIHPLEGLLAMLAGRPLGQPGAAGGQYGDYVLDQHSLDEIITRLMEQSQGARPVPAPDDMIAKLPRTKVTAGSE